MALLVRPLIELGCGLARSRWRLAAPETIGPATVGFCSIHCGVSLSQQTFGICSIFGEEADTDARSDFQIPRPDAMRLGNAAQYTPGSFSDIVLVRNFGEKNHEFVAALAAEGIAIADAFSQSLRDGLQKDVARIMAVFVVHLLEAI